MQKNIEIQRDEISRLIKQIDVTVVMAFAGVIRGAMERGNRIFTLGNGGSAALASHMAIDLIQKGIKAGAKQGYMAIALSSNEAVITALANDFGYEKVFGLQLEQSLQRDDVIIAISTSGKSANVVYAIERSVTISAHVLVLTGQGGQGLKRFTQNLFIVESANPKIIESVNLAFSQLLVEALQDAG